MRYYHWHVHLNFRVLQCSTISPINVLESESDKDTTETHADKKHLDREEAVTNDADGCDDGWCYCERDVEKAGADPVSFAQMQFVRDNTT